MSWLARSIANSLRIDDDDNNNNVVDDEENNLQRFEKTPNFENKDKENGEIEGDDDDFRGGVKDDLSEFKETLTRQIWGVANFLAPPPPPPSSSSADCSSSSQLHHHDHDHQQRVDDTELIRFESSDPSISGDEVEDESSPFKKSSTSAKNVMENCNISSNLQRSELQNVLEEDDYYDDDDDDDDDDWIREAVGITEEVLTFAENIAHHPETWLDFSVEDEEDFEDFPMSESQKSHAQAVEHLTPRLAALRFELCPAHMSMGFFWKVYFVLLHSRLNKQDAELLSTPEIVEARAKWIQDLQKPSKKDSEWSHGGLYSKVGPDLDDDCTLRSQQNEHSETLSSWMFASEPATSCTTGDSDVEKHVLGTEFQFVNKAIIDEKSLTETDYKKIIAASISKRPVLSYVDDGDDSDDWPEDDCLGQSERLIPAGVTDEVSFSDLEDDDCSIHVISKP